MLTSDWRIKIINYGIGFAIGAALSGGIYYLGVRHGTQAQLVKQQALQKEWDSQIQTAQQQYIQKLQEAQTEKDKWYAFAQKQSTDLAKANQALDTAQGLLRKDISNAIKNDEKSGSACYSGLGVDSLRLYNKAFGYPDSDH